MIAYICIVGLLAAITHQHAVLTFPRPWDPNPSKSNPCGNSNAAQTGDIVNITVGETIFIQWRVVAGDGSGDVTGMIDPTGGKDFTVPITSLVGKAPGVGSYTYQFQMPNVSCPNDICTAQIKSSSNWYSCFSFRASGQSSFKLDPSLLTRKVCRNVNNLGFCNHLNGKNVLVPVGANENQIDGQLTGFYEQSVNNPNVMTMGSSQACQSRLKFIICAQQFTDYCGRSSILTMPDQSYCDETLDACKVTDSHLGLFNCTQFAQSAMQESEGTKRIESIATLASFLFVWLTSLVI
jgi:hypothetical protein